MEEVFYTKDNYWVVVENDIATIGISDYLLDEMDIVNYIELPAIGAFCSKTDILGIINYNEDENIDLFAPFNGEIADVNESLLDNCEQILSKDINNSWLFRVYVPYREEFEEEELMSEEEYKEFLENGGLN